jgi:hypothetical protein
MVTGVFLVTVNVVVTVIYQANKYSKKNRSFVSRVNFHCKYFHLKMVVRPKHVAAKE